VRYYELTHEARREFARIATSSLLAIAESEAVELKRKRVSFRRHRVERRVVELRLALEGLASGPDVTPFARPRSVGSAFCVLTILWLLSLAEVIAYVAASGIDTWSGVGETIMLIMTCLWFAAAVGTNPDGG
jgi:hypothetical protein